MDARKQKFGFRKKPKCPWRGAIRLGSGTTMNKNTIATNWPTAQCNMQPEGNQRLLWGAVVGTSTVCFHYLGGSSISWSSPLWSFTAHISNNDLQRKMNSNTRKGRGRVAACRQAMKAERAWRRGCWFLVPWRNRSHQGKVQRENERVKVRRIFEGALWKNRLGQKLCLARPREKTLQL